MNNSKVHIISNKGTYNYGTDVGFKTNYITNSDSSMVFERRGDNVTCTFHLTGEGGAFQEQTFVTIGNSNLPAEYTPSQEHMYFVTTSTKNIATSTCLGVLYITSDGEIKLELLNKKAFNLYGVFTYAVK